MINKAEPYTNSSPASVKIVFTRKSPAIGLASHSSDESMIALSTGSLYNYSVNRIFALAAETGFDGVELIVGRKWETRNPAYLLRLSSEFGLPIVALHTPFVQDVQDWPESELKRLEKTAKLAQELDVRLVVAHLPRRFYSVIAKLHLFGNRRFVLPIPRLWPGSYFRFVRDGQLHELESSFGGIVALENMPASRFWGFRINAFRFNSPAKIARFRHLTLDTTHLGTWGVNPLEIYEELKESIVHVHLSNFNGREHQSPVDGHLPLSALLRNLARDGYPGVISLECDPDALQAEDEEQCRVELERALIFCREHFSLVENRVR